MKGKKKRSVKGKNGEKRITRSKQTDTDTDTKDKDRQTFRGLRAGAPFRTGRPKTLGSLAYPRIKSNIVTAISENSLSAEAFAYSFRA
jgi:hypothetical protein